MGIKKDTATISLSTVGSGSGYNSTGINGLVHKINVSISGAVGANSKVTITSESTKNILLVVADPSTLGTDFYPRNEVHGSTGNTLSSTVFRTENILCNERFKVSVTSSSGLYGESATVTLYSK